ncbi:MAG: hypothetical protein QNJ98_01375 [Planctomycetota bacterium]|nr:hypothetical protein [Planctomycetota bacterium]
MKGFMTLVLLALVVGLVVDARQDWKQLRDWGVLPAKGVEPVMLDVPVYEPMGVSVREVMRGLEHAFELKEWGSPFEKLPQPRYTARDDETLSRLEIRGERRNIGFASLSVSMPILALDPERSQTEQVIGISMMRTFLRNAAPDTRPDRWLDGMIAGYNRGETIRRVVAGPERKVEVRRPMRGIIKLIVTKS